MTFARGASSPPPPPEEDILKMGILVYVPFLTSRGPISRSKMPGFESFPLPISHFPFPTSNSLFLVSPLQERREK